MAYRREDVVGRLTTVVGPQRADELLRETMRALGASREWDEATSERVVERLAATSGSVGSAMRLLRAHETMGPTRVSLWTSNASTGRPSVALLKLITMLGASLGDEKARTLVEAVVQRRQLSRETFGRDDAFIVLEEIAREPGVVGTVARFAKARVHLEVG